MYIYTVNYVDSISFTVKKMRDDIDIVNELDIPMNVYINIVEQYAYTCFSGTYLYKTEEDCNKAINAIYNYIMNKED